MDYSNNDNPFIPSKHRKADPYYKTRGEGRPRPVVGMGVKKLKFKKQLWTLQTLVRTLQSLQPDRTTGSRPWTITCNNPARSLKYSDYILVVCLPKDTVFEVHVCEGFKTAIVQQLFPDNDED